MKKKRSRVRRVVGFLLLATVLLFALIQTPPGKAALARILSAALSASDDLEVRVRGISGWIPAEVDIESVEIGDAAGPWLSLRDVRCRWSLRDLLDGRVTIQELGAGEIEWQRIPARGKRERDDERTRGGLGPYPVRLETLNVGRLLVGERVAGTPLEYSLSSGGLTYQPDGALAGELAVSGDAEGLIVLQASLAGAETDHLKIGVAARRVSQPTLGLEALAGTGEVTIDARGVHADVAVEFARNGQQGRINTQLAYAERELGLRDFTFVSPDYSLGGDLTLEFVPGAIDVGIESSLVRAGSDEYTVRGRASVATSNQTWGVEVRELEVCGWEVVSARLSGSVAPERVALRGEVDPFDLGAIPLAGCSNLSGEVSGAFSIAGDLAEPEVAAEMSIDGLASGHDVLDELPVVDFKLSGVASRGRLVGAASVTHDAAGRLSASFAMPCALSFAPFHYDLAPREGEVAVEGDLDLAAFNQRVIFKDHRIGGALRAEVRYAAGTPTGSLWVRDGCYEQDDWGVGLYEVNAEVALTPDGVEVVKATATDGGDGTVAMTGGYGAEGLGLELLFDGARVLRRDEVDARVSGGLGLSYGETWAVDARALEILGWDAVPLRISGSLSPERVALSGGLAPFDLGVLPMGGFSNFTGAVAGSFSIEGSLAEPAVAAELSVEGLASRSDALDELPELDLDVSGGASGGKVFGVFSLTNELAGHLLASFDLPCAFSLVPFNVNPAPREGRADVEGDLDLAVFNQLAFLQNQLIRGALRTKVEYAAGKPEGFLSVENGHYEHFDWGVVFHNFNADFEATPEGFKVNKASATDGRGGGLSMSGGLSKAGLDLKLDFAEAQIIRRDEIEATMSGWLGVTGRPGRPDITAELTIDRAEILLDNIAPPPPPLLTNYDASKTNLVGVAVQKKRRPPPVGLDIKISMPAQVFVIAAMIEATLEGELRIKDTPKGVSVTGRIEPRRGFVNFIGKKFRFTGGDILLDGSIPTIALLNNLTAEYARRDVIARLLLNGPANDPRFRLESTPALPEDEVLSHVLFNRDTSSISPYQAFQIAMAARQLSGGLNGPGFMFQVRQAIGVDTLEWREADAADGTSSVAAGKYIASGLYVEVNRELDSRGETGMMAEFEITRHFSVETYTGPKLRPGIGVNWRNDY